MGHFKIGKDIMIQELSAWKQRLNDGLDLAHNFHYTHAVRFSQKIKQVVFCGMGGSGVAGRLVKTFLDKKGSLSSFVIDSPEIPQFVDGETLAIVVSYSGNTWETVSCLNQLLEAGVPTVVMAHGGKALKLAAEKNVPSVIIPEAGTPRAALGYFLGFLFGFLDLVGILTDGKQIVVDFADFAEQQVPKLKDPATFKDFLDSAEGYQFFHSWGVRTDSASAMFRAQTQFNENAKMAVVHSVIPELCHNLLVGFTDIKEKQLVLVGHTSFLPERLSRTVEVLCELLQNEGVNLYKVPILGDTWHLQFFHMILWGDFASYHLGVRRGVDISATRLIDGLKAKVGKRDS